MEEIKTAKLQLVRTESDFLEEAEIHRKIISYSGIQEKKKLRYLVYVNLILKYCKSVDVFIGRKIFATPKHTTCKDNSNT